MVVLVPITMSTLWSARLLVISVFEYKIALFKIFNHCGAAFVHTRTQMHKYYTNLQQSTLSAPLPRRRRRTFSLAHIRPRLLQIDYIDSCMHYKHCEWLEDPIKWYIFAFIYLLHKYFNKLWVYGASSAPLGPLRSLLYDTRRPLSNTFDTSTIGILVLRIFD